MEDDLITACCALVSAFITAPAFVHLRCWNLNTERGGIISVPQFHRHLIVS